MVRKKALTFRFKKASAFDNNDQEAQDKESSNQNWSSFRSVIYKENKNMLLKIVISLESTGTEYITLLGTKDNHYSCPNVTDNKLRLFFLLFFAKLNQITLAYFFKIKNQN